MTKLDNLIREINESGYEDGENGAGHIVSIEQWKDQFKDMIQVMIDETFNDNDALAYEFWQKVKKL